MTTTRKTHANRRNAAKSTGPRTDAGKAVARCNALRHGMTARVVVLPGDDQAEFDALAAAMRDTLAPRGALETMLTERAVSLAWRLGRAAAVDAGLFMRTIHERARSRASAAVVAAGHTVDPLDEVLREVGPRTVIDDHARHEDALRRYAEAHAALDEGCAGLAETWTDSDGAGAVLFERLARYEGTLSRELFRTLHELERIQAHRIGPPYGPPGVPGANVRLAATDRERAGS